jgi:hypothetical protein
MMGFTDPVFTLNQKVADERREWEELNLPVALLMK